MGIYILSTYCSLRLPDSLFSGNTCAAWAPPPHDAGNVAVVDGSKSSCRDSVIPCSYSASSFSRHLAHTVAHTEYVASDILPLTLIDCAHKHWLCIYEPHTRPLGTLLSGDALAGLRHLGSVELWKLGTRIAFGRGRAIGCSRSPASPPNSYPPTLISSSSACHGWECRMRLHLRLRINLAALPKRELVRYHGWLRHPRAYSA